MKIDKKQVLKIERSISRDMELESGLRINHKKVHKSKKAYDRKSFKLSI